jgi:hypothetical protein
MYRAQVCYFNTIEHNIKEIVYVSFSNEHAINEAILFANDYVKSITNAVITRIKIFAFAPSSILPNGKLVEDKGKTLFSWDYKNAQAVKDHLKRLRNEPPETPHDFYND